MTVLWDITYALEIAHRITLGALPYRDFVVPQGPITFVLQTAILAISGGGLWPHLAYCALIGGLTAVFTYRLVRVQLGGLPLSAAPFVAFALTAPVVFLNGYAILPLPFYDPDCVFFALAALTAVLWARERGANFRHVIAGALLVLPVFVKQNIGIAAFISVHAFLLLSALGRPRERRAYGWVMAGSAVTFTLAVATIQLTVGAGAYHHWTVEYAASRRWPSASLVLSLYSRPRTWVAVACAIVGYLVVARARTRAAVLLGLAVAVLPWMDATRTMVRWGLAARSYALWGLASVTAVVAWIAAARERDWRFERAVPLVAIAIAHGAFASQGVADSSYGVWPFLLIALAWPASLLVTRAPADQRRLVSTLVAVSAAVLMGLGYLHVTRHERLGFADISGPVEHATHPRLRGLSAPGTHLSDFERLLRRCEEIIPHEDGVLPMPGEDPFFFASQRTPRLPVVLFDDTAAPYDRETILRMLQQHDIKWVIVKTDLQLWHSPWRHLDAFVSTDLPSRYTVVDELPRYRILRRQ